MCVWPAIVTWRSCITSSSALCTLAGARLISSASSRWVNTGPSEVLNSPLRGLKMRVPTRSAGTRSGVNWIRLKVPRKACARVFTVSVLASPGTPSTSRWPCASTATITRSRKWSWPTTTRLTSYRTRSISVAASPGMEEVSVIVDPKGERAACAGGTNCGLRRLERRHSRRRGSVLDRHGEADADEDALAVRVQDRGDDADHLAVHRDERAARVARVGGGVELDQVGEHLLAVGRAELALQARDDAGRRRRADAEREADRQDMVAGGEVGGRAHRRRLEVVGNRLGAQDGEIVLRLGAQHHRVGFRAVEEGDADLLGAAHDSAVLLVVATVVALGHQADDAHHRRDDRVVGARFGRDQRLVLDRLAY